MTMRAPPPPLLTRALHLLPPEAAHALALWALGRGLAPAAAPVVSARLTTSFCGIELPHPLGLAAGLDKNADAVPGLFGLGFGFVEIGTVTPRPQAGNPKPRLFRLRREQALINRMGFNNDGVDVVRARLMARDPASGPLGANIGANRDSAGPGRGLRRLPAWRCTRWSTTSRSTCRHRTRRVCGICSSGAARRAARRAAGDQAEPRGRRRAKPLLVKIAPDLAPDDEVAHRRGGDGPRRGRPDRRQHHDRPTPGGRRAAPRGGWPERRAAVPALDRAAARFHRLTGGKMPLIGVGGILRGADAYAKIRAGASALQLYTALVYRGPHAIVRILAELERLLERDGIRLSEARGIDARA